MPTKNILFDDEKLHTLFSKLRVEHLLEDLSSFLKSIVVHLGT